MMFVINFVKTENLVRSVIVALGLLPLALFAQNVNPNVNQEPTVPWTNPQLQPQMLINVEKDTNQVHLIQTNNDPYVYTKTYVLKHANPYEARNALLTAVQSRRVSGNDTRIECIQYNDGVGMLIVSAEGYRFSKKQNGGMSIDELVKALDQPKLVTASGTPRMMYFPKHISATELKVMVDRVGINPNENTFNTFSSNSNELENGRGTAIVDNGLNAISFYVPPYCVKQAIGRMKEYDMPIPEVKINCTVYEIFAENDAKIGADFQSWKNGPGADLFNLGGRWRNHMQPVTQVVSATKSSSTKYIKFNPKWNSKYLDFLAAEGKAKVLTSGQISVRNRINGVIEARTQIPHFDTSESVGEGGFITQYVLLNGTFYPSSTTLDSLSPQSTNCYRVSAYGTNGESITLQNAYSGNLLITRSAVATASQPAQYIYSLQIPNNAGNFLKDGVNIGSTAYAREISIKQVFRGSSNNDVAWQTATLAWNNDYTGTYTRGPKVQSVFTTAKFGDNDYGYRLEVVPVISEKTSILQIQIDNVSLMGFRSNGEIRTTQSSYETEVMIDNAYGKLVIGGIEKQTIVRGVTKVPWLGSIPGLGWLFGSETEDSKKSQIVTVLECVTVNASTPVDAEIRARIAKIEKETKKAGENELENPDYGFNQFLLDATKTKLEPLP